MLRFRQVGEDICDKQKQYKWGAKVIGRLSLDMRSDLSQSEGFSRANLYHINAGSHATPVKLYLSTRLVDKYRKWIMPIPQSQTFLLCVPWRLQTVLVPKHELSEFGKGNLLFQRSSETLEDIVRQEISSVFSSSK